MKKAMSLILALMMCLSLCACGGEKTTLATVGTTTGSEIVELTVSDIKFYDGEYPFYSVEKAGHTFVTVLFTLKNIGKDNLGFWPDVVHGNGTKLPSGILYIDYSDGYKFYCADVRGDDGDNYHVSVFYEGDLLDEVKPLGDAIGYAVAICVPNEAIENTEAPLNLNFYLPSSKDKTVTISYDLREVLD